MNRHIRMLMQNKGRGQGIRAEANTIWLYDVIASDEDEAYWYGGVSPQAFIAALTECDGPVTLRINSPGGSVFGAQAMIAAMQAYPHAITARIDSLAASAASVIAASAARCEMVPRSMMMIHKAWGIALGNEDDMRKTADLLAKIDGQIAATYAERSGEGEEGWLEAMRAETWYTAEEAVTANLADAVVDTNTQRASAKWDLSAFMNAPVLAEEPEAVAEPAPAEEPAPVQPATIEDPAPAIAARQRTLTARLAASPL